MGRPTKPSTTDASTYLQFYGGAAVIAGLWCLIIYFNLQPGAHGIASFSLVGKFGTILFFLGLSTLWLWRWAAVLLSLFSGAFGIFFLVGTLRGVEFPGELVNVVGGILFILPIYLTRRVWEELK